MRGSLVRAIVAVTCLGFSFGLTKGAASDQSYTFYGTIAAIDLAAHTLTIKAGGRSLVFHITPETHISSQSGYVSLDRIKIGRSASVIMRLGEGNVGIAVSILLDLNASPSDYLKLFAARTVDGSVVSGLAVKDYVAYRPRGDGWSGSPTMENTYHDGVFLLEVRPDGTVSEVKMIKSMGYAELNLHAIRWFKQWRFKPNTVTEVQIPKSYRQSKY